MRILQRRIVVGYIISSDGQLLLGKKVPGSGGVYPDSWHNPGGGVEQGETDEQALAREVYEETAIDIHSADVRLIDDTSESEAIKRLPDGEEVLARMHFLVYKILLPCPAREVVFRPTDDLVELQWFPLSEIDTVDLTPPARVLLTRIGTNWFYEWIGCVSHLSPCWVRSVV